jgi:acetylornithine/succinyldiaminopimelate/putrescine aminotransferase
MLRTGVFQERSAYLGTRLHARLRGVLGRGVSAVHGRGLWAGLDLDDNMPLPRSVAEVVLRRGVLVNAAHGRTLRVAPPLVISDADLDWGLDQVIGAIETLGRFDESQQETR